MIKLPWINTKDKNPKNEQEVLIKDGEIICYAIYMDGDFFMPEVGDAFDGVEYWFPLINFE